ncbi:asparagine synthase (glutamine-hydrolyzing) [Brevibacillus centrosporus]|uniref:asparagine synthase (glutamine-hydrolyzing) n=1 Tax=Brevibacillus centrosporus TaxID=54910 RepID=A0A1I3TSK2_9BACL|nr:asparagine synthase (glutamine-hydrolyzing) [Brevibacillus centrosporus]MEC2132495.1 asparagine synthase (glutamine-hydrolyzing) [Brevibacillus centrosporus]MED4908594.1 asparagine synthase (glutamine-hydrolyzing) [Brevibacillus centrosporus]RNB69752.1 asparagine synthase (glutamine-hydrolyzing) [Brevibacillus centrosporus]SFJ74248.1 asparagine synthase (glutamine-hydrolysing) [Brevibacillus centrosporus]GED29677.1 asparagine synthetase B [Brevibacillus centrosporus]
MCGIVGWIDWEKDLSQERPVLHAMTQCLTNRGPDAEGFWLTPRAAFGHRRLVVVDPAGGQQPMAAIHNDYACTMIYNGELYNTEDLRAELLAAGHTFQSHSDTEVLLHSYLEWGTECVARLNGIFAFAIWDERYQRLFVARDRMGVKPLFYVQRGSSFLFASELKSLLAHPDVRPVLSREGLAEVFAISPARTPGHGVFRDVHEVRPGYSFVVTRDGLKKQRYWQLESHPHTDDAEETARKVRELVTDSIHRQLVADVPVSTLLSGGLDSSVITAVAAQSFQKEGRGQLHTYSIDYVDNARHFQASAFQPNEDAPFVKVVSDFLGTQHHNIVFDTHELIDALKTATLARDLPGMADVDASLYLFCREIKKETTVVLSGECADEVFGGYPWFHRKEMLNAGTFPWARATKERASWLSPELRDWVNPEEYVAMRYEETLDEVPQLPGESPFEARRREMFYLNITWFMNTLLDRKDRMSMAASLEARVPFCDHRIVEYVWNIPWALKTYGNREKGILRKAMEGILPDEVLYRKKSPYPKTHNPSYTEGVRTWLLDILGDPTSPLLPLIDVPTIRRIAESDAQASSIPFFGQLMSTPQLFAYLGQLDYWLREYHVSIEA